MTSKFAEALAYKCIAQQDGVIFFEGDNGVEVFSLGVQSVHCHSDAALDFVRAHIASLIEAGYKAGFDAGKDGATPAPSEEALEAAREEGRRLGWKEAVAAANRARIVEMRAAAKADGELSKLRNEIKAAEEAHGRLVLRYEGAAAILDAVTVSAPKESP